MIDLIDLKSMGVIHSYTPLRDIPTNDSSDINVENVDRSQVEDVNKSTILVN